MRLLLTIPDIAAATGGPPISTTSQAAALKAEGDEVHLLFAADTSSLRVAVPCGVHAHCVPQQSSPWQRYRQFRSRARQLIASEGIEIVHDHGLWLPENVASADAAQSQGVPWIAQPCGMLQDWSMRQSRLKKQMAWQLYQRRRLVRAAALVSTSEAESTEAGPWLPGSLPLACIPYGIDIPNPLPHLTRERQAVFLGRLHPKKQVDVLLTAWAALRPTGWQLRIAGSGEPGYVTALKQQATRLGLGDDVQFVGAVHGEQKSRLLFESRLFLQPSQQENFGLAVAEALAHGLPAITTTAMPWSALVEAGCGWNIGVDAVSITTALGTALALPDAHLEDMGQRARRFAAQYSWAETARGLQRLYSSALTRSE